MSGMRLAVLGVPSSIGARNTGTEKAPQALRAAGLLDRIRAGGHDVEDRGDQETAPYVPDPDHAREQNVPGVAAMARTLAGRIESVLREGRKALVLGGDCTIALGSLAGITRIHPETGLAYLDRDAELNTPRSSGSGILDGMVIAHLLGRGVPELVRLEDRSPLLRPARLALLGVERLDPQEVPIFDALPCLRLQPKEIRRLGPQTAARETLSRIAPGDSPFYVHLDMDAVDGGEFPAVDFVAPGGLGTGEVLPLLAELAAHPGFLGIEATNLNPDRDPGGAAARKLVELIGGMLDSAGERS
jgi:arginase